MVVRQTLIMWICLAIGCFVLLEQPSGSLMEEHPRLKHWMDANNIFRHSFNMGDFGARTQKPQWLYSQFEWISDLDLFKVPKKTKPNRRLPKPKVSINTVIPGLVRYEVTRSESESDCEIL